MRLSLVTPSVVSSDNGLHLSPAGLFKYQVCSDLNNKKITFWAEFGELAESPPTVTVSFPSPPLWDDDTPISREAFGEIAQIIGDGFALKGFQAVFTVLKPRRDYNEYYTSIHETEGGKWLDEVSRNPVLTDTERAKLWSEALRHYHAANLGNHIVAPAELRPGPMQMTSLTKQSTH